ncbi:MAG: NDP-sugar synthase [Methanobacteriota archaeon]|nr:MAG: NDP-sugar synthase [Euryarchaeota archaeon]
MKAVVLAGGEGTRLKPLTYKRPKPLMPVAGRPCIDYVLRSLATSGFHEIIVTTSYLSDALIKSIGDGGDYNASILYSFEENPAGTAGAVRRVGNFIDETFVVAMGDILCDVDFKALYDFHKRRGGVGTIALTEVDDPTQYGIVGLDAKGRIAKFREKPKREEAFSNLANAGIYVLEPEVLDFIPSDQKFDFAKDLFPKLLAKGVPLHGSKIDGVWMDIGRPHDLWKASMEIVRREGKPLRRAGISSEGPVILDAAAQIEDGVTIRGPCYVGSGAVLRRGSIADNACLYEGARVEGRAVVRNSIVLEGSVVGAAAEIVDSVVSRNCIIEDGARIASSIIGDSMTIRAGSRLENATVSQPP